jgi:PAS domain S-box-containing protein
VARTGEPQRFEDHAASMQRWFDVYAFRIGAPEERRVAVFFTDITKRKEAEARAQMERQKLHDIFQQAPVGICILEGPQHTFTFANPPYLKLVGEPDIVGKSVLDALPAVEGQGFVELLDRVVATAEPVVGTELPLELPHHEGGAVHYMNFVYQPMRDGEGQVRGVLVCVFDVTQQVLARQRAQELVAALERERELREQFVATLSHDLRTPLTTMKVNADRLLRRGSDPEVRAKASARISDNIERADRMIRDLLDANRIRAGEKLPLQIGPCELRELVAEVIDELAAVHGERLVLRAPARIEGYWSRGDLRRIVENLCTNAIKYGASDRIATVSLRASETHAEIEVQNFGPPISEADRRELFVPFRRTRSAQAGGQRGWGLGLTLVRGVAEAHGGMVEVRSNEVTGTIFTVRLPIDARGFAQASSATR